MEEKVGYISKKTKRSIFFLLLVCICIAFGPRVYYSFFPKEKVRISFDEQKQVVQFKNRISQEQAERKIRQPQTTSLKKEFVVPKQKFDPQT